MEKNQGNSSGFQLTFRASLSTDVSWDEDAIMEYCTGNVWGNSIMQFICYQLAPFNLEKKC